jgi:arylamine N-acetyltransferase
LAADSAVFLLKFRDGCLGNERKIRSRMELSNSSWSSWVDRRTHVASLLQYDGQMYLVDTGFGGNLPLKPVPLNGETTSSVKRNYC